MLLELYQLSESLRRAGIVPGQRDGHLKGYPRGQVLFRVRLNETAEVSAVDQVAREQMTDLLMYRVSRGSAQESIPGFNVPPLFVAPEAEITAFLQEVRAVRKGMGKGQAGGPRPGRERLHQLLGRSRRGWDRGASKLQRCLSNARQVLHDALASADEATLAVLAPLMELLRRIGRLSVDALAEGLARCAKELLETPLGLQDLDALIQLFFTKGATVMLELGDSSAALANSPRVWQAVNRVLLSSRPAGALPAVSGGVGAACDSFGRPYVAGRAKLPDVRLPQLGPVTLRSHSAKKPCQNRYGLIEAASCPVSQEMQATLQGALEWLAAPEREGKTYCDVSSGCGFRLPALLFAYPDPLPDVPPFLAAVFARTGQATPSSNAGRFEAAAELVTKQLTELIEKTPAATVSLFVLAKADKARARLLMSRHFEAQHIIQAAQEWRAQAQNIPPVYVRQFLDRKVPAWLACDRVPFPTEVGRCLNRAWQKGGTRVTRVHAFDVGSELTLFLDTGHRLRELALRALRCAVAQWIDLLLAVGHAAAQSRVFGHSRSEQLLLPSILGLLLAKLGHTKERYMNDVPYWVGRLLSIANRLQVNYCNVKRDREIPQQLIGNALMATCLENPRAGLARLAERLALYYSVCDEDLQRELAEVERHIDHSHLPELADDEQKAQMLLGYIARPDLA